MKNIIFTNCTVEAEFSIIYTSVEAELLTHVVQWWPNFQMPSVDLLDGGLVGVGHVRHAGSTPTLAPSRLIQTGYDGVADGLHLLLLVVKLFRLKKTLRNFSFLPAMYSSTL